MACTDFQIVDVETGRDRMLTGAAGDTDDLPKTPASMIDKKKLKG